MFEAFYREYLEEFIEALRGLDVAVLENIMKELESARQEGRQVFVIGNGGSAASASHWACDFGKGINVGESKRLRVFSLIDNTPLGTAISNDISYDEVFTEQLKNYLNAGDVIVGLSVSGNSENVVRALAYGREQGAKTICIIGSARGRMAELADILLVIESGNYGIVEDTHMLIGHVISQYMRRVSVEAAG
ncbi:MAG: SIS domain-containing protein [Firmicutes bacterium]|jgi:D-sedoheptulose 7-phosphate isomerase|nr:SIS domain-containing protein [Bacillota bacterium]